MQNKNIIVGLFSMLVVVIFGIGYSYADDVYNYESVISTSDWSNMNHAERVEKLSIPNEYIQNMTTTELLNSVLAYPYFSDMLFYDNMQEGFYAVKEHFNGLQELLARADRGEVLLSEYKVLTAMHTARTLNNADYDDSAQKTPAVRKNVRGMNAPITNNATIIPTGFSSGIVGSSWPDVLQNAVIRCIALLFQEKHFR